MQSFNPFEMWQSMGFVAKAVVVFLLAMSVYSLWVMIDRYVVFRRAKRSCRRPRRARRPCRAGRCGPTAR